MSAYFIDGRKNIKTILSESISLQGDISFEESLEIHGDFSGTIRSKGLLIIGKTANITGDIYSKDLIIEGKIQGNILVYNRLSIGTQAEITGNITTHKLKVANNSIIDGECATLDIEVMHQMFEKNAPETYFRPHYKTKNTTENSSYTTTTQYFQNTPSSLVDDDSLIKKRKMKKTQK